MSEKINKIFSESVQENVLLADYTTMKVGGPARYFYTAKKIEDFIKIIIEARKEKIPFVILGGGSNVIISDKGFNGLVILNRASNIVFIPEKAQVFVDSGISLMRFITESANRDLGGLEGLYGIPGTVGGAIYGNAGAHGSEICSYIKSVTLLTPNDKIIRVKPDWLEAEYRATKIKKLKKEDNDVPIILSVKLQLSRHKKEEILRKLQYYKNLREEKQPYNQPSAGSVFKNITPSKTKNDADDTEKSKKEFSAGYILEQVGAKKIKIGGAEVSKKHANFVINSQNATSEDVKNVIKEMKKLAHDNYGVELEEEVEYI